MDRYAIKSISELCARSNVHRNTVHHYLTQKRTVVSSPLQKIANTLGVDPFDLLVKDTKLNFEKKLIDILRSCLSEDSDIAVVLIGSRAKGTASEFSDYDLGLTTGSSQLETERYLLLKDRIQTAVDSLPISVDVVALDAAPEWFLDGMDCEPRLLLGNEKSFNYFLGKLHGTRKRLKAA